VEDHAASLPPPELQTTTAHVEAQGLHAAEHATRVVEENEAALQDFVEDENLPSKGPEDDESNMKNLLKEPNLLLVLKKESLCSILLVLLPKHQKKTLQLMQKERQ
jgi:hypothetical protein